MHIYALNFSDLFLIFSKTEYHGYGEYSLMFIFRPTVRKTEQDISTGKVSIAMAVSMAVAAKAGTKLQTG